MAKNERKICNYLGVECIDILITEQKHFPIIIFVLKISPFNNFIFCLPLGAQVALCHMACKVGKRVGGLEEVTFLYRLTSGACPKSYGVNVARLAGKLTYFRKKKEIVN